MSKLIPSTLGGAAAAVLLCTSFAAGQVFSSRPAAVQGTTPTPASGAVLTGFHITKGTVQSLTLPPGRVAGFTVDVVLARRQYTLQLREHDVRAANFKLIVHDQSGYRTVPTPANTTYQGEVRGFPGSIVSASLVQGQLQAIVSFGQQPSTTWGIQPVSEVIKSSPRTAHVVYDAADSNAPTGKCGVAGTAQDVPISSSSSMANSVCEIACDADLSFYQRNGSNVTNTQNDVTNIINRVEAIYKRDVQIEYKITAIIVRTSQVYSTNDPGGLLNQFRSRWLSSHGNIKRDVAHLFTGRNLSGNVIGVAWLRAICTSNGFGLSQSRFTSNLTSRTGLTAHELGHNWGANHCSGGACYIMCAGLGGCGRNLTLFAGGSKNAIINHRNSRSCLSPSGPTPQLTAVTPNRVQAWRNDKVALTGNDLSAVTRVFVGGKQLLKPAFQTISNTRIEFETFIPSALLPVVVSVESPNGRSNGLALFYDPVNPPRLEVPAQVLPTQILVWEFGGGANHNYFLTLAPANKTFKFLGFDWLLNSLILTNGKVDAAGYGFSWVQVPASIGKGLKVFSQVVMVDPSKGVISGTTNVTSTTVQ